MPRQPRLELAGGYYHVMARGDRREAIFRDDDDRRFFLHALGQACERTGWQVLAWVLMANHYHLALHTPEPNLVTGMKWLQNAYTRRFNTRHRLWGHLFGGRYKSIVLEDGPYVAAVVDYVHLNPVRAGLADTRSGLERYRWSSLRSLMEPARRRPAWLGAAQAFQLAGVSDTAAGRRGYLERLESVVDWRHRGGAGLWHPQGGSLHRSLRRGWCFASEAFREKLVALAGERARSNANYRASALGREHGQRAAEALLAAGLRQHRLDPAGLRALKAGDLRKRELAWALARHSTVPQSWIAQRLGLGSVSHVSHLVARHEREAPAGKTGPKLPSWMR